MQLRKKIIPIIMVILLLIVGIVVVKNKGINGSGELAKATPVMENKISVKVAKVHNEVGYGELTYDGTVEPVQEAIVSSKISGKVVSVKFENGSQVQSGQALILLDDQDLRNQVNQANATLMKVQANVASVQRNLQRARLLYAQGGVTKNDLDAQETAFQIAKADLLGAQIALKSLQDTLSNTVIKSPIGGVIDEKNVNIGQFISPGVALAKVKDISKVNAVIEIQQKDLGLIKLGQKATLTLLDNNKAFQGVVTTVNASADPSARVFTAKVQLDNQDLALRPGLFGKVNLSTSEKKKAFYIPVVALSGDEDRYQVFVAENGVAHKVQVEIGAVSSTKVEIKTGLKEGQVVITSNLSSLQDGDKILISGQVE